MENLPKESDYFALEKVQRINTLNTECEEIEENYNYSRPLSDDEIRTKSASIIQALQEIERLKDEIKDINALKKIQSDKISEQRKEVISKFVQKTGKVWKVINVTTGYIEFINEEGYIIDQNKIKSGTMMNMFNKSNKEAM